MQLRAEVAQNLECKNCSHHVTTQQLNTPRKSYFHIREDEKSVYQRTLQRGWPCDPSRLAKQPSASALPQSLRSEGAEGVSICCLLHVLFWADLFSSKHLNRRLGGSPMDFPYYIQDSKMFKEPPRWPLKSSDISSFALRSHFGFLWGSGL